ncbi:hypothetical protein [Tardiphaga alba]|nr:hypothetical protein [Tardiphaga alba]
MSQTSPRPWAGGNSAYGPHAQLWMPKLTSIQQDIDVWPQMDAFFSRLGGQAGLIRIGDASRLIPQYNRERQATTSVWSDGTMFTDGTGFVDGLIPPTCHVLAAASRGATSIVLGGLPASLVPALRRGDLFEIRPNGIPADFPHLYQVMVNGPTNADGETGVEIRPPLRADIAAGDQVVLDHPTSVFHLIDDSQAEMEINAPITANFGFSLIEAIERI